MIGNRDIYYWDTCTFCAWLADEQRKTGEMDGVREVVSRIKKRDASLVTSSLMLAEVLPSKYPAGVYNLLEGLLRRNNIQQQSVSIKIARFAGDIRDYYDRNPVDDKKKLATPDSIHLATAIICGVTEFHTFDNGEKDKKFIGLLQLDGNVAGHKLSICKPTAKQPQLDLVHDSKQNAK